LPLTALLFFQFLYVLLNLVLLFERDCLARLRRSTLICSLVSESAFSADSTMSSAISLAFRVPD